MIPYTKYKDSGIKWIGEIPETWVNRKIARSFNLIGSGTTPKADNMEFYNNGDINWVLTGDLKDNTIKVANKKITTEAFEKHSALKMFPPGTLLIAMYGATIGKVGILDIEACTNQACCALAESELIDNRFLFYWFIANREQIINLSYGGGQPNISQEIVKTLIVPSPEIIEQKAIVSFLDKKTSEIDETIKKKEKLIELLEEERKTLINEAVTKGLDSNTKMKHSGIDWLGDIPEHWNVVQLKRISRIRYGLGQPPKEKENGLPIIRATNIERGKINKNNLILVDPDDLPYDRNPLLVEGEIIVVRSGAYTADSALIPKEFDGAVTGYDMVLTTQHGNPNFVAFALLSNYLLEKQLYLHRLRAAQPHLNAEELGSSLFLFPPLSEQTEIVEFLNNELYRIDNIKKSIIKEIELLKEYKQALIFEAVTGKIDVREKANSI